MPGHRATTVTTAGDTAEQVIALVHRPSRCTLTDIHPLLKRVPLGNRQDWREDARYFDEILRRVPFLLVSSVDHKALDDRVTEDLLDGRWNPVPGLAPHPPFVEVVGDRFKAEILF